MVFAALSLGNWCVPVGRLMLRGHLAFNSKMPWRSRAWAHSECHSGHEQIKHLRADQFLHSAFPAMSPRWTLDSGSACPEHALRQEATSSGREGKDVCWGAWQNQPSFGQPQGVVEKKRHLAWTEEYKDRDGVVCRLERRTDRNTKKERRWRKGVSDWEWMLMPLQSGDTQPLHPPAALVLSALESDRWGRTLWFLFIHSFYSFSQIFLC